MTKHVTSLPLNMDEIDEIFAANKPLSSSPTTTTTTTTTATTTKKKKKKEIKSVSRNHFMIYYFLTAQLNQRS